MLKKMREAGFPRRLVSATDLVPDHVSGHRRAMIRDDDDFKTVTQGGMVDFGTAFGASSNGQRGEQSSCEQQGFRHQGLRFVHAKLPAATCSHGGCQGS